MLSQELLLQIIKNSYCEGFCDYAGVNREFLDQSYEKSASKQLCDILIELINQNNDVSKLSKENYDFLESYLRNSKS